jgi:membrane protein DedA with SNARE-associated domain/rhodanese-related sulfurtransferase
VPAVSIATSHLIDHGYAILFVYVFLSQLGVPLPSSPLIMAAGALAATGRMRFGAAVAVVAFASLFADSVWYHLGRARGTRVIRTLCGMSLEPEACVLRTRNAFDLYGARFLLVAKFIPGLGLMAAPIAGQSRMRFRRFLAHDAAGALIWTSALASLGVLLGQWLERSVLLLPAAAQFGATSIAIAAVGIIVFRLLRRRRFRMQTGTARITAGELKQRMDRGERVYIVDLRHAREDGPDPQSLPGAVQLAPDEVLARKDLPKDGEIVLFCDCPGEASAALVATALQRSGFPRARPLEGGIDAWRLAGYPLERLTQSRAA